MAERSKAPDSRFKSLKKCVFWSVYTGVGSNPTAVKFFSYLSLNKNLKKNKKYFPRNRTQSLSNTKRESYH